MLQRKIDKVLSASIDSPDVLAAIQCLSEFYTDNTHENRLSLQGDIERRGLLQMSSLLESFRPVANHLDQVQACVNTLEEDCAALHQRMLDAKKDASHLVSQTKALEAEREQIEENQRNVDTFLRTYYLSPEEEAVLDDQTIEDPFFEALDHIHIYRERCKTLLQNFHQRAGLEMMDSLSQRLEMALETLCRWCLGVVRTLTAAQPDVSRSLSRSFHVLRCRPAYFNQCVSELRSARRSALLQRFMDALQVGGPNGMPRPIELHAHDPLRYASDMLAYLHQSLATEKEVAIQLFCNGAVVEQPGSRRNLSSEELAVVSQHLTDVIEGVMRPLRGRISQALESERNPVVSYKLSSLLVFYRDTFQTVLSGDSEICQTLQQLTSSATSQFFRLVQEAADGMLEHVPPPPRDLCSSPMITEALENMGFILQSCDSSMASSGPEIGSILSAIVDPLLQLCSLSSKDLDVSDRAIYHINIITLIQKELRMYEFAQTRMETLSLQLNTYMETLVAEQTTKLLRRSGVDEKLALLSAHKTEADDVRLSTVEGLDALSMSETMRSFYHSVFALGALVLPQCDRLCLPQLRNEARDGVARAVASAYAMLYNAIDDPRHGYDNPHLILQHSPEQMSTLLDG